MEEAVHEHVLGVASSFFSGPPSSGSLHEDVASVLEVLWLGCDGILAGVLQGDAVVLGQLHWLRDELGVEVEQDEKMHEKRSKDERDALDEG